MSFYNTKKSNK